MEPSFLCTGTAHAERGGGGGGRGGVSCLLPHCHCNHVYLGLCCFVFFDLKGLDRSEQYYRHCVVHNGMNKLMYLMLMISLSV